MENLRIEEPESRSSINSNGRPGGAAMQSKKQLHKLHSLHLQAQSSSNPLEMNFEEPKLGKMPTMNSAVLGGANQQIRPPLPSY